MLSKLRVSSLLLALLLDPASAGHAHQDFHQKRAGNICGSKGYDAGKSNYYYDSSSKYATYDACSAKCIADTKCKSFGYSKKECMLFSIVLTGNFDADSGSSDTYYDRACISSPAAASTTTTSSATKAAATTTSTTVKAASSVAVASSAAPAASGSASVPAGCTAPAALSITSFSWFNSTHNLDCATPNYSTSSQVCWTSTGLCTAGDAGCTCTPFCTSGIPSVAFQPLGYGSPDTISIGISGTGTVTYTGANPQSVRRWSIGAGHFDSGSGPDVIGFTGDSSKESGSVGSVYYNALSVTCNGLPARYSASFPLSCAHDAGLNATCTAPVPVALTFVGFS